MHICDVCKNEPAVVHLTDIHNNVKKEVHMCEGCARKKGFSIQQAVEIPQMLGEIQKQRSREEPAETDLQCDVCEARWSDFRSRGRFGCPHDYEVFRERLRHLLNDIHVRAPAHVGKAPAGRGGDAAHRREVLECQRRLREAVGAEDYEEAARLRDRMRDLRAAPDPADASSDD